MRAQIQERAALLPSRVGKSDNVNEVSGVEMRIGEVNEFNSVIFFAGFGVIFEMNQMKVVI